MTKAERRAITRRFRPELAARLDEYDDMRRRALLAIVLSVVALALAVVSFFTK